MKKTRIFLYRLSFMFLLSTQVHGESNLNYLHPELQLSNSPELTDIQWRWLGEKRLLKVGIYGPQRPPLLRIFPNEIVSGYLADLTWIICNSLGISIEFIYFNNSDEAWNALKERRIDTVLSPALDFIPNEFNKVTAYNASLVNVVRAEGGILKNNNLKISDSVNGELNHNPFKQLSDLAERKIDKAVITAGEAYYLIKRNYLNILKIDGMSKKSFSEHRFVFRTEDKILIASIKKSLNQFKNSSVNEILLSRWDQNDQNRFITTKLELSDDEIEWIDNNKEIVIAMSSYNAPFFIKSDKKGYYGIVPDLLSLISIKTGLKFRFKEFSDSNQINEAMGNGNVKMTAPIIWSKDKTKQYLLTQPFMVTPQVLITRKNFITKIRSASLLKNSKVYEWFKLNYPEAEISQQADKAHTIQLVIDGKMDATIDTLISAKYLSEGLYNGLLTFKPQGMLPDAYISLGIHQHDPELLSIINKTLNTISPGMITNILAQWQPTPQEHFDTWKTYRSEIYLAVSAAFFISVISGFWILFLKKKINRIFQTKTMLNDEIIFRDRLINGPPRPIYVANVSGFIIHTNSAFDSFFGSNLSSIMQFSLFDKRHPLYEIWIKNISNNHDYKTPLEAEFSLKNHRGNIRRIRHWLTIYHETDNKTGGYIGGWQDVTEYIAMQAELKEAKISAEQASRAKSQFLATMSHEIRTPLSAIIGLLELQVQEDRSDTELINVAYQSSQSLLTLIGDILDIIKIESGKMVINPEWFSIESLVTPVAQVFNGLARQKGLNLLISLPSDDFEVYIDGHRLRQVISNLVNNAIKFTFNGKVEILVTMDRNTEPGQLSITVSDTGKGIKKEAQINLFSPFEQVENIHSGSGLGLSICKELISLMGGSINLQSELNIGTSVYIKLPVSFREVSKPITRDISIPYEKKDIKSLHVLIVDDHPANRLLLSRQLKLMGHSCSEAVNGHDGFTKWKMHEPDIILTDCSMPILNGLEMTKMIRAHNDSIQIIGITADAQEDERLRCIDAGMNYCLFRPVKFNELAMILDTITVGLSIGTINDWISLNIIKEFLPDDRKIIHDFIKNVITETKSDLSCVRDSICSNDNAAAFRYLHRITGALCVIGEKKISLILEEIKHNLKNCHNENLIIQKIITAEKNLEELTHLVASHYKI